MKNMTMLVTKLFVSLLLVTNLTASEEADSLDKLLKSVRAASISDSKIDRSRLQEFLQNSKTQDELLRKAIAHYNSEMMRTKKLKNNIDVNEKELARLEEKLKLRSGNLGEMFGVVRQIGADLRANIDSSSTSVTIKDRVEFLDAMLNTKELPDIEKLEELWYLLQEEIIASGKVTTQKLPIILPDGSTQEQSVTSVGIFNAFYNDKFLRYSSEARAYVELPAQPSSRYTDIVEDFADDEGVSEVVIDPTRGELLGMYMQRPTVMQRVDQGGVVGYIILLLGLAGLALSAYRYVKLSEMEKSVNAQLENLDHIDENNPLGRVMSVFHHHKTIDLESFEAKIEEAVLKELPSIKSFENLIKLIATVAPLLGLLGTVTGMIETFGAITLFGTGDPKLMAGGISQALMTTVLGLVIAIPMLFLYTFISSRSNKIVAILDEQSAGLIVKKMEYARNR